MQVLAARVPSQGDVFSRHGSHEQYIARHILHMKNMLLLTIAMLNYQRVCLKIPSLQPRRPCGEDNSLFPGKLCDSRGRSVSGTWYMCIHLLKYTRFMVSIYILYIYDNVCVLNMFSIDSCCWQYPIFRAVSARFPRVTSEFPAPWTCGHCNQFSWRLPSGKRLQKTMENHHFYRINPLFLWPFSSSLCGLFAFSPSLMVRKRNPNMSFPNEVSLKMQGIHRNSRIQNPQKNRET